MTIPKEGRVLVDFFATWCGPCKMISKQLEKYEEEVSDVTVLKIDVDLEPELASENNIRSIPTLIYFEDGEVVERKTGNSTLAEIKTLTKI
jgi:thioredoxin 1|tara:strand:- start:375 stop:647 length:273 start_codon:yes stop_codon:yes gene_type:complete